MDRMTATAAATACQQDGQDSGNGQRRRQSRMDRITATDNDDDRTGWTG